MTNPINLQPISVENTVVSTEDDNDHFFELSQELLCTAGFDGYFKKLNSVWEKTLGFTKKELRAKPFIEFVHIDDQEMSQNLVTKLVNGHHTSAFENRLVCKDGTARWILWSTVSVVEEQLMYASGRDITDRKKNEQDLDVRTKQFECLLNAAPFGIHMIDENFNVCYVNPIGLPAFGNTSNLIGRDFGDVVRLILPATKANEIIDIYRHTLATGKSSVIKQMNEQRLDNDDLAYYAWETHRIPLPNNKMGVVTYFQDISQSFLAQQKIIESEVRYHTLFNCMDEGYCVVEMLYDAHFKAVDYRFLEVNDAFEQQSGVKNATGKTILELFPDFNPGLIATYGQVALTGEPIRFEHEVPELKSWFDIYAFRIKTPELNKIAILFNNITDRKLAQLALTENQERLEAFVMSISDVTYSMSADWREMNQLRGNDFIADTKNTNANWLKEYIHPRDQDAVNAKIAHAIQSKTIFEMEHQVIRVDGSLGWTFSRAVPLFNKLGDITEWFGTASDVTNRRLAQIALRESEERFKILFELGPVAMYTVDAAGTIQEFNRHAVNMWGREPQRGDHAEQYCCAYKVYTPDGKIVLHAETSVARVLNGEMPAAQDVEAIFERLDGTKINVIANVVPLKNASGKIIGAMSCLVDITDRKTTEDVLFANNIELQEARLTADKANLAKSEFLSSMSHELRTPLNAILGFAQLLQISQPAISDMQQKNVKQILHGGWHLLELVNEILDLAQIESGQQNLVIEPVEIEQILQECKELLQQQAALYEVKLQTEKSSSQYSIMADTTRLKQVLINLISNAIKYNKKDGFVKVSCRQLNDTVRISVMDTGAGMNAEELAQLFQPFNRLDKKFSAIEGTGIGLVVSKNLVELMQGTIGVKSTVGVGSEFWIEFKLHK